MLSEDDGEQVIVRSSLPEIVEPETSGHVPGFRSSPRLSACLKNTLEGSLL
jgi:hypothetical protein